MKYAVIKIQGHQYRVSEGDEILVDKLPGDVAEAQVLMLSDEGKVTLGTPILEKAKVALKMIEPVVKGEKIYSAKYHAKSRYRRRIGFRAKYSKLLVQSIKI
ncbi:MAG TPA: 50S ribosomal protein L21 [Patescibacteria group bacterium]|nr:50S ribosomal protein L21 [Patescibacteria group bacterium]